MYKRHIIGYARVGHVINAIEISEEEIPYDFYDNYEPSKYIYDEYEGIIINPNYEPPQEIDHTDNGVDEVSVKEDKIEKLEKEFSGNGRVLIRPSGTEPLVRVMVEAKTQELCESYVERILNVVERELK